MDTNRVSLIITIEEDCSSVKFKGECDGAASADQNDIASAIYAAVTDVVISPETLEYYLEMAAELSKQQDTQPPSLRLVN